ncbi:MAG: HNH endonuclease signature motif containing protein [Sphingomonadaceae bacterium]
MRNLPEPSRDADRADLRKSVRQYRYGGKTLGHDITDAEIEAVVALYDKYEVDRGAACDELKGPTLPTPLRDAIHAAYEKTQETRVLYSVRELLFKGVELCPVCGIDPATELDHHLPQSAFKPLAIHTRNLVPMCHPCNHAKLAGFDVDGSGFLHPYYEVLPDLDFLQAIVDLADGALVVTFAIDGAAVLPAGYANRLTGQMEALDLDTRYQQEVNTYISSHAAALHLAHSALGQAGVQKTLRL